ncbi:uncharacterized protein V1513DRAFT_441814 [Lipomyces chichibuensis]|uniref:uncharacterized protein n=1 Tax=Lipomyces chichibuensis TaxID=1546026 RepID=UPI003343F043
MNSSRFRSCFCRSLVGFPLLDWWGFIVFLLRFLVVILFFFHILLVCFFFFFFLLAIGFDNLFLLTNIFFFLFLFLFFLFLFFLFVFFFRRSRISILVLFFLLFLIGRESLLKTGQPSQPLFAERCTSSSSSGSPRLRDIPTNDTVVVVNKSR